MIPDHIAAVCLVALGLLGFGIAAWDAWQGSRS